jgi:DtxR family Mn-dependent transcriptional regulator
MSIKKPQISQQAEEYLEAIYRLEKRNHLAKTMELAKKLNVVPGSITNTIESLEKRGFVNHTPYKGVKLTEKGKKIAANIIRKHRLAERLLTDFIHIKWSTVHEAACKLEHALSPEILNPLETALGNPRTCPHGNPIPTKNGILIEENSKTLTELRSGEEAIIIGISDENQATLKVLEKMMLKPQSIVKIQENRSNNKFIKISINKKSHKLDKKFAGCINVKSTKIGRGDNK